MRYLITGGAGFIGSHLAEALLENGHTVSVIDDLSTGRFENIEHLVNSPEFSFAIADVRDEIVLDRLASQADAILHLAAAVGVHLVIEKPVHTIESNIGGTQAVLQAALRYRVKVLITSSSEVYGKGSKVPFSEDDDVLLGPTSRSRWVYSASKMVDEFLGLAYMREHGLPVIIVRLFNTVGPRQTGRYGMVLPRFVSQALRGEPITVYGDGSQSRCFCAVADVVRALIALVEHPRASGQVVNVGSTEEITILELAKLVKQVTNSGSEIRLVSYEEAYSPGFEDMHRRVPDTTRVRELIDWAPASSLEQIVGQLVGPR
jgi:UDP-glucose 4-epimerase